MTTRRKAGVRTTAPRKKAVSRVRASAAKDKTKVAAPRKAIATFPADCTIAQADDMKSQLARMLAKPATVTLDLSSIRRIDTAALQVLTAFVRERRAAGRVVHFSGISEPFMLTAELLGLSALFSLAVNA